MKIRYQLALRGPDFTKEICIQENILFRAGTQAGSDLLLPPVGGRTEYSFTFRARETGACLESGPGTCFREGQTQLTCALPADFALTDAETGRILLEGTLSLQFEKAQPQYTHSYALPQGQWISVGGEGCTVRIHDRTLRQDSLLLRKTGTGGELQVCAAQYGASVNGKPAESFCMLGEAAFFSLDGYEFYFRGGYLYCDSGCRITVPPDWKAIRISSGENHLEYPKFNRSPRFLPPVSEEAIEILLPQPKGEPRKQELVMKILPSLIMLAVTILLRGVMGGGGTYIIISAMSMGLGVFTSIYSYFKDKKDTRQKDEKRENDYRAYIEKKRAEIEAARSEERQTRCRIYRTPQASLEALWSFSAELFDRSVQDADFLQVYLGSGVQPAARKVTCRQQETIVPGDELMQLPEQLAAEYAEIDGVPVTSDLLHANAVGLVGPANRLESLLCNMTLDLCTRHLSSDVHLFYMLHTKADTWLRWLPHVQNRDLGVRNIVCGDESRAALLEYLYAMLAAREQSKQRLPHCVVFVESGQQIKTHPLAHYLPDCAALGVTFVFLEQYRELLPDSCGEVIELDRDTASGVLTRRSDGGRSWHFAYGLTDEATARQAALRLAPVYCEEISIEGALPRNYSFFDSFGVVSANALPLEENWKTSDVSRSLAAPIGVNAAGEIVFLDIHEKAHGPHGLVAGTTGSGKSEFLQSYLAAMGVRYSPLEVAFLIIDFKGGGMANQLKALPHLVGTITNIDGREIARSLAAIRAELEKRQRLFDGAKVNHIDKYIRLFKSGQVSVPLPHLIIVVDEFAELKANQPDFMNELISAARIGRSLGIHLILATQKPAGQVNDQIWSNSRFRLCFKVQNQADSSEMLKSPLAAEIKEAGRGYFQVGNNEIFELFQSAYSGGSIQNESREESDRFSLAEVSLWGERKVVYSSDWRRKQQADLAKTTQLQAVLSAMVQQCRTRGPEPLPGICLPPLPEKLPFVSSDRPGTVSGFSACVGISDDPSRQRQDPVELDLTAGNLMILGSARSGKTTALQTIIRSLAERYTSRQVQIYILDFASMILTNFDSLAHVGGVAVSSEEEKVQNLFKLLLGELAARKKQLLKSGVSSFAAYLEAGKQDLPQIVLILDNFTAFRELYEKRCEDLLRICREGVTAGISVIMTNVQTNGLGYKYLANFTHRMAFFCQDSGEYGALFELCRMSLPGTPGRGLIRLDNRILEFQACQSFPGEREIEQMAAVRAFVAQRNRTNPDKPARRIPVVPELITASDLRWTQPELYRTPYRIPVGMNYAAMEYEWVDLQRTGALGICGREGPARTNLLWYLLQMVQADSEANPAEVSITDDAQMHLRQVQVLPCVEAYSMLPSEAALQLEEIYKEIQRRKTLLEQSGMCAEDTLRELPLKILVLSGMQVLKRLSGDSAAEKRLMELVRDCGAYKVCVILAELDDVSVSYGMPELLQYLRKEKKTIMLENVVDFKFYDTTLSEEAAFRQPMGENDAYGYFNGKLARIHTIFPDMQQHIENGGV